MADDIVTDELLDDESEPMEFHVEYTSNIEYLSGAFYAISSVAELDPMTKPGKEMKNRILTRAMRIVDLCISEMYEELFDPAKDEE